jgi:hypothetical protein
LIVDRRVASNAGHDAPLLDATTRPAGACKTQTRTWRSTDLNGPLPPETVRTLSKLPNT